MMYISGIEISVVVYSIASLYTCQKRFVAVTGRDGLAETQSLTWDSVNAVIYGSDVSGSRVKLSLR